jgi:precorrin-4/cobalt-precorrin-4 C11-methyltransferase
MHVYFVGAGPGDPELITLKGARLIAASPIIIYTGSLVPREVLMHAHQDARIYNSASMDLSAILDIIREAHRKDEDVVRLQTGDSSIYGSIAEQIRELNQLGIPWQIVPGVSSFTAGAAALGAELTLPEVSQTIILTRTEGRTPMPAGEKLADLARHRATMVIFLSAQLIDKVVEELTPAYGPDAPVRVVHKASWPAQQIIEGTLATIAQKIKDSKVDATALIYVGGAIGADAGFPGSKLYDAHFSHGFRPAAEKVKSSGENPS